MNKQGFTGDARVGYYGKVPSHGDFVTNRLERDFVEQLDLWLQKSIQDSKTHLGSRWLDAFLVTPIWRFAFAPGVCGVNGVVGLIMPSVDRVGRYFPLVLVSQLSASSNPVVSDVFGDPWFDAAEDLARATLEVDFNLPHFDQEVAALPALSLSPTSEADGTARAEKALWWTNSEQGELPDMAFMTDGLIRPRYFHCLLVQELPADAEDLLKEPTTETNDMDEPMASRLEWYAGAAHHQGTHSGQYCEAFAINEDRQLFGVVGALQSGPGVAQASQIVASTLSEAQNPFSMNGLVADTKAKLGTAHALLHARGMPTGQPITAAATVLLLQDRLYAVLWVGNARSYLLRDGILQQLTRDHTDPSMPTAISRALGNQANRTPDSALGQILAGDRFLVCTSGLSDALAEEDMIDDLTGADTPEAAARALVEGALIAGSPGNITAISVFVSEMNN